MSARRQKLSLAECARLERIAVMIDLEAQTWRDGFASFDGVKWSWGSAEGWAHARFVKLENAADFLRSIARRPSSPP